MKAGGLAERVGGWSARHRSKAILAWVLFVVVALLVGGALGTRTVTGGGGGNGTSGQAQRTLAQAFPQPAQESVLVAPRGGNLTAQSPRFRATVSDLLSRLRVVSAVANVRSPYARRNRGQISRDGDSALVQFDVRGSATDAQNRVQPALDAVAAVQRAHPGPRVEEFGDASSAKALGKALGGDFQRAETLSIPITLAILVLAFGALVAAVVPVVLALTAVAATVGLLAVPSQLAPLDGAVSSVVLLIGMAVGIDYALFYIRREREERAAGASRERALATAAATSGRAVLVSGVTVMIAMAGMFLTGNATFSSFAVGTMIVVAVAMVGSVTFLPAMLAVLGDRIELGHIPRLGRRGRPRARSRLSTAVARSALRRPLAGTLVALTVLAALAVPAFGLQTLVPGAQSVPANLPVMKSYARIQAAFPGGPAPAQVVVAAANVGRPAVRAAIARLERSALATGQVGQPMSVSVNTAGTVAVVAMPLVGGGTDATSNRALVTLRGRLIPRAFGRLSGVRVQVTGETAQSKDFNDLLAARTPLVFAFVLGLAFLLLLVTFRSLTIPVTAIALTLLSVGAAYGVLVLVFQHHWAEGLLGFHSIGGITSWLPLFLFIVLFGLSMDYHVFILSRIKEARDGGMSTRDAVAHGLATTAGVVNSAAIVMAAVFAIFATLSSLEFKQLGVGLAAAVLIDATLIRCVLLPAVMTLLGEANWYLPRWMRSPLGVESAPARPQPAAARLAASRRPGAGAQAAVVVETVESAP